MGRRKGNGGGSGSLDADPRKEYWRSPIPEIVGENPVAVMVTNISERLIRNPTAIPIIVRPSPHGERRPSWPDMKGAPEMTIGPVVIDPFPGAIFLQLPGMIM